jgi:hypothetical protein
MTLSKMQFTAIMIVMASLIGIGVGWLPRLLSEGERPQIVVMPPATQQQPAPREDDKLVTALRKTIEEVRSAAKPKKAVAAKEKPPVRYQGKAVSDWITVFRDRDDDFRQKAVEPLLSIAEVDRTVIPVLLEGLKDKYKGIPDLIAGHLAQLNPPAAETAAALLQSSVALDTALSILTEIDPKGVATLPLVREAMQDSKLRLRAGFMLIAFDRKASLPSALLVEALEEYHCTLYKFTDKQGEDYQSCPIPALTAWLLRQTGLEATQAVSPLLQYVSSEYARTEHTYNNGEKSVPFRSLSAELKTENPDDWLGATLRSVDPRGEAAIPLLLKTLAETENADYQRCLIHTLGMYGDKARAALPMLRDIAKNKKVLKQPANSSVTLYVMPVSQAKEKQEAPSLPSIALEAARKIDPKAARDKSSPAADSKETLKESRDSSNKR